MKSARKILGLTTALATMAMQPIAAQAQDQMSVSQMESALGLDKPAKQQHWRSIGFETPASDGSGNQAGGGANATSGEASAPQSQAFAVPIEFDSASSRISSKFMPTVTNLATVLRTHPDLGLEIRGHTDSTGSPAGNMTLSEHRAQAVRAALVHAGISPTRLRAVGYGQSAPIDGVDTRDSRNRRVEFVRAG